MVRTIQLTQGKEALVDDEDFEELNCYKWHFTRNGYAARREGSPGRIVFMHNQILAPPAGYEADHKNEDGLNNRSDNRRANLRIATRSQNCCNRGKCVEGTSQYKGVSWNSQNGKWRTVIQLHRKLYHIGRYDSELIAAIRYDLAARELHGEFCKGNFTDDELAKLVEEHKADLASKKTSRFRGVYWSKRECKWQAEIKVNYRKRWIGQYANEEEAAKAYDRAAFGILGNKAKLNFPDPARRATIFPLEIGSATRLHGHSLRPG